MYISFAQNSTCHNPITINHEEIERVTVGRHYHTNNLKWENRKYVKRASSKLHFLCQLKSPGASTPDLLTYFKAIVRSHLEYAIPGSTSPWFCIIHLTRLETLNKLNEYLNLNLSIHSFTGSIGKRNTLIFNFKPLRNKKQDIFYFRLNFILILYHK